jgi:hypothetical protein
VERGVEDGHLGHALAQDLPGGVDPLEVGGVVERGEVDAVLDLVHDHIVDGHGLGELLAAVDDAVADGGDVADRGHPGHVRLG